MVADDRDGPAAGTSLCGNKAVEDLAILEGVVLTIALFSSVNTETLPNALRIDALLSGHSWNAASTGN